MVAEETCVFFLHLPREDASIMSQGLEDVTECPVVLGIRLPEARQLRNPSTDALYTLHPDCQKASHETFCLGSFWAGRGGPWTYSSHRLG